jgi:pimeloyl-ACP methyl ester carboxylesterase
VAQGADHLREIAAKYALDLKRVVTLGHSAGGHLALWLAARHKLPATAAVRGKSPLAIQGVVALAAVSDLALGAQLNLSGGVVQQLMGGDAKARAAEYALASPLAQLPLGIPQQLVHGTQDDIVPFAMSAAYATRAKELKDTVQLVPVPHGGHFDVINPRNDAAWKLVVGALKSF